MNTETQIAPEKVLLGIVKSLLIERAIIDNQNKIYQKRIDKVERGELVTSVTLIDIWVERMRVNLQRSVCLTTVLSDAVEQFRQSHNQTLQEICFDFIEKAHGTVEAENIKEQIDKIRYSNKLNIDEPKKLY